MPARTSFEYAVVRLVPRVDRAEAINVGVILYCLKRDFLDAHIALDAARALALWPALDLPLVEAHLAAIPRICVGAGASPIERLSQRERFHWLVSPRSTIIQMSAVHSGLCEDPRETLARLVDRLVRVDIDRSDRTGD